MENIAILMGGSSKEKEVSLKSASTIYNYIDRSIYIPYKVLCIDKFQFKVIHNKQEILINNDDFSFNIGNRHIQLHKVFMMIHGAPGENGELCAYLEEKKIPYTSCNQKTSELTFNKFKCNNYLRSLGYKVPNSFLFKDKLNVNFPCIIKPACSGSSFGISKVNNETILKNAIQNASKYDKDIIIEEFIEGREVTCGVFRSGQAIITLPITEIISENEIFDYDAKYNGKSIEKTPANINVTLQEKIEKISKEIYKTLKMLGIIRIDFIIKEQHPYIIEINTVPGFSEASIIPQMLKYANIDIRDFITKELKRLNS